MKELNVSAAESGQKLLNFLMRRLAASTTELHKWIRTGQVRINGGRCKPFDRVEEADSIRIPPFAQPLALSLQSADASTPAFDKAVSSPALKKLAEAAQPAASASPCQSASALAQFSKDSGLVFLAANEHIAVINKSRGFPVQAGSKHTDCVVQRLQDAFHETSFVPSPAHRLDKDTSGILMVGMSYRGLRFLNDLFSDKAASVPDLAAPFANILPLAPASLPPLTPILSAPSSLSSHTPPPLAHFDSLSPIAPSMPPASSHAELSELPFTPSTYAETSTPASLGTLSSAYQDAASFSSPELSDSTANTSVSLASCISAQSGCPSSLDTLSAVCQLSLPCLRKEYLAWVDGLWQYDEPVRLTHFLWNDGTHMQVADSFSAALSALPHKSPSGIQLAVLDVQCLARVPANKQQSSLTSSRHSRPSFPASEVPRRSGRSLLHILLHTGRKHQIRVQLAHVGSPLLGDTKYGHPDGYPLFLHAVRLTLPQNELFPSAPILCLPNWTAEFAVTRYGVC